MASNSKIEWTHHTFNPWWGCTKVHSGCKNCYAEVTDARWGGSHWGPKAPRRMIIGEWSKVSQWNADAADARPSNRRVFVASMCDIFEEDTRQHVIDVHGKTALDRDGLAWTITRLRERTFGLIAQNPYLVYLLLTKRPENIPRMVPKAWLEEWPRNVWTGTSPCDGNTWDASVPPLQDVPGRHFLSVEPLIGRVDRPWFRGLAMRGRVDWVIVGGESGPGARTCNVDHVREIVEACRRAGVPVFVKQLGARCLIDPLAGCEEPIGTRLPEEAWAKFKDPKGGDMDEWPVDLRVRQIPQEIA